MREYERLVREHAALVRRVAQRAGIPERDVQDIAQRVFVKLHESLPRLDTSKSLAGWLRRTTYRMARDHLQLGRTAREIILESFEIEGPNMEERMAERIDVHRLVDSMLDTLPPEQRVVFAMSDLDDMPMSEIVETLAIPTSTAYARLHAARAAFEREWNARRGLPAMVPIAFWGTRELLAAEHNLPAVPRDFTDGLVRGLSRTLGPRIVLSVGQAAVGVAIAALAGAGLHAAIRTAPPAGPVVQATVATAPPTQAQAVASPPPSSSSAEAAPPNPPAVEATPTSIQSAQSAHASPSASAPHGEDERKLLAAARLAIDRGDNRAALALLDRVRSSRFAGERAVLRRIAQGDAGK